MTEHPVKLNIPHVYRQKKKSGKWGYRFEKPGKPKRWLKHEPGTPEFEDELRALQRGTEERSVHPPSQPGTFSWLVRQYALSATWGGLSEATKRQRAHFYSQLETKAGARPAAALTSDDVRRMRDARIGTPGAARNFMKALSALYDWGVESGHVSTNPVRGVKRPAQSRTGFRPWTVEDVHKFRETHATGTKAHLALSLLLFTAARRSDVVKLGRQHMRDGWLSWKASKAPHEEVAVPILPPLAEAIRLAPPGMVFLMTEYGKPHSVNGFGTWWSKTVKAAGINAAPAHGLRKAAGGLLADFGCSEHEIMAVLGHSDPGTARIYTRSANRRMLAESAMKKMAGFKW